MNVEQLKDHIQQNPSFLKKLMFMGSNIRGSKAYWKSRCGELRDMVEQIGLPTVFLTMSAADFYWPDLFSLLSGKDINDLSMQERRKLVQENPLVVDMFFDFRLKCFIENVLEPKYEVVDYWYRIEYQHRGSPHVHGLFWFKGAPDVSKYIDGTDEEKKIIVKYFDELVTAVNPHTDCPVPDSHPCEKLSQDVVDVKTDLAQLLKNVQRHSRCSTEYCLRVDKKTKQTRCRFHFPMDITDCAGIEVNVDSAEMKFVPERNDERLNKFNPFIISSWRANIDIAPVLSKNAIIEYLSKYVSKSEPGSKTLQEISSSVCGGLNGSDKAKRAIQRILIRNCVERDISAQEVCHILMGQNLFSAGGRNFVVVYTKLSDWVPLETNDLEENEKSYACSGKSFMQKYCERPSNMEGVSMWDSAKYYNARSWKKCKKPNIVRVFPRLSLSTNEEKNEEFYRQKVLLFVPWRNESDLRQDDEQWRDVYDRLNLSQMKVTEVNINVSGTSDKPEELEENVHDQDYERNEDWMIASRLSVRGDIEEVELGRREVDLNYDWQADAQKYKSFGDINYFRNFIENEKKKGSHIIDNGVDLPDVIFSEEQEAVRKMMERQINHLKNGSAGDVPKRVLVQGKAGTGKSLLIRYLCANLHREFGEGSYLLVGPTGVSAINIGGVTVHSVLRIPIKRKSFKPLKAEAARKFADMMEKVKFVILDEYSMVGCSLLGMIDHRLREGTGINEVFGGLYVYFFGDYKQLPPVKDTALYGGTCSNDLAMHGRIAFSEFDVHYILKKGHRQKDLKFLEILDRLSVGDITEEDYKILKTRFTTNVHRNVQEKFNDAIRLFATKDAVENYNMFKLEHLEDGNGNLVPIARIPAKHQGKGASYGSNTQANGLSSVLYLAKGTRIMLRSNLWVKMGLVNGSMGIVVDLLYEDGKTAPQDAPTILMCKFDNYCGPGIGADNLVPISTITQSWTSPNGIQCTRQQFPVVVCYGCSIHKSQGLTMNQAVIDLGANEFALGLCYVGMSRVKTLDGLLLKPFSYQRLQMIRLKPEMTLRKQFSATVFSSQC